MKQVVGAFIFFLAFAIGRQASCATLPDACGNNKVQFDVKTAKAQPAPSPPAAGQAQIVLIEDEAQPIGPFMYATVRFGLDGAWVGADKSNSYFAVDVAPGQHHLCASWQSAIRTFNRNIDLTSFTAKPGSVYYFRAKIVAGKDLVDFSMERVSGDEGRYRIKSSALATAKQKN